MMEKTGINIRKFISDDTWAKFEEIISDFMDNDVGKQEIIWAKKIEIPSSFGEDDVHDYAFNKLEVLCNYNAFRNWPINKETNSGELDQENLCILVSKRYLETNNFLNEGGYFDYNWAEDRFILHGIVYKPSGDTEISQTNNHNILFQVILKRDRESDINFISRLIQGSDGLSITGKDSKLIIERR